MSKLVMIDRVEDVFEIFIFWVIKLASLYCLPFPWPWVRILGSRRCLPLSAALTITIGLNQWL